MATFPDIQKRNWVWNGLLLIMFSTTFDRALGSADNWLPKQSALVYLSLALTPLAFGLASTFCATTFMRKFGEQGQIPKNLRITHGIAFLAKTSLAVALIWAVAKSLPAALVFGAVLLLQALVGWALGCVGIEWQRRIAKRRVSSGIL